MLERSRQSARTAAPTGPSRLGGAAGSRLARRAAWAALSALLFLSAALVVTAQTAQDPDRFAAVAPEATGSPAAEFDPLLAERLVREAAAGGARYVVLPDLPWAGVEGAEPIPGPTTRRFGALAAELGIWLALPVDEAALEPAQERPDAFYRTLVLFDDRGAVVDRQRKIMPGSRPRTAALRADPRSVLESVDDRGRRIGILWGDDLLLGVPRLASRGADTILVAAAGAEGPAPDLAAMRRLGREYGVNLVVAGPSTSDSAILERGVRAAGPESDETRGSVALATLPEASLWRPAAPLGLPSVPVPTHQPAGPEIARLGRDLFFDPGLSSSGQISCASCHQPEKAFANGRRAGRGVYGRETERNVPSLLNVAFRGALFWDARATSLENQAKYPISAVREMDFHYLDQAVDYVRMRPHYVEGFRRAMGVESAERLEFEHIARALATYQRTLLAADSPFDRYLYLGVEDALAPEARRGLALFRGRAGCSECHTIGARHSLLTDNQLHNTGVGFDAVSETFTDPGVGLVDSLAGSFLTPSLRNVAATAPYMHDGSVETLEEVVAFYDRGGEPNPNLDPRIRPLGLTPDERRDLVAFLRSLGGAPAPEGERDRRAVRMAAANFEPEPDRPEVNWRTLDEVAESSAGRYAEVLVLPQSPGSAWRLPGEDDYTGATQLFSAIAEKHELWIAVALETPAGADGERTDRSIDHFIFDDEGWQVEHRRSRPDTGPQSESETVRLLRTVPTPFGRLGLLSGDELMIGVPRFAELGASVVLVSAEYRWSSGIDWHGRASSLAEEQGVPVVVSNLASPAGSGPPSAVFAIRAGRVAPTLGLDPRWSVLAGVATPDVAPGPLGLPPVPLPASGPLEPERVALGRDLFFDPNLSADGKVSCADCHEPARAFTNGEKVARGVAGRPGTMNVPTVLNSAYKSMLFWRGTVRTLESQVEHALLGWPEMDSDVHRVLDYLESDRDYRERFKRLTGDSDISFEEVARSIAAFERTLLSGNSAFDRYYFGGDDSAIGPSARRGLALFTGKAGCDSCHTIGTRHALFTDNDFHNTGVGFHPRFEYLGYSGDGLEGNLATNNGFRGRYFTPSLRDVALTAPYMHDGSLPTLRDVVDFYARGGQPNPHLDPAIRPLELTEQEKDDLVAFLNTLTGSAELDGHPVPRNRRPTVVASNRGGAP